MAEPQVTFKLRVKIGDREFEAEGGSDVVARRFEEFRAMVQGIGIGRLPAESRESDVAEAEHRARPRAWLRHDPQARTVSLKVRPEGAHRQADAALLVLLGHRELRGEEEVAVTRLTEALRQSGCPVARLDRVLAGYLKERLVLKAGQGKGGRYRLTNQGVKRAEELAAQLTALVE